MSHIKKFSYQDTSKRWLIPIAVFLTFFILLVFLTDIVLSFKQYLPYYPVASYVMIIAVLSFFIGNISGKFFYTLIKKSIFLNISVSLLFALSVSFYLLKTHIIGESAGNLNIYVFNRYLVALIIFLPAFFSGILNSYLLNISTGDFLDEKNLLSGYIISIFTAVSASFLVSSRNLIPGIDFSIITPYYSALTLFLFIIIIFINKNFNPEPLYAKHYIDEEIAEPDEQVQRDDLFYTYMNFTFIITYIFLGDLVLIKFFGNIYYNTQIYIAVVFISMAAGFFAGKLKKPSFWYVYSEMLFPVIFLSYLFILYHFSGSISINIAYLIAAAPPMVYGFSLRQTFQNILSKYDHNKRYNIINFSTYILPIPVILSISFLNYSNLLFFTILYIISILNITVPGIFLFNFKINPVKKIAYFLFTLFIIPAVLMLHLYFKIPMNMKPFFTKSDNFEILLKTNFNQSSITEKGEISIYGTPVFYLSDSNIRNLKRTAAAVTLYSRDNSSTLIIDSNQKFFSNPVYGLLPDFLCLDTVSAGHIDNNRLPVSGNQQYVPVQKELLNFLLSNRKPYDIIFDSPNILDQTINPFRVSSEYYTLIKKHLPQNGIYAVAFDLKYVKTDILLSSLTNLKESFQNHTVYLFSDILLIISSDSAVSLKIDKNSLKRITSLSDRASGYGMVFYNEIHPLNNIIYTGVDPLMERFSSGSRSKTDAGHYLLPESLARYYLGYTPDWFKQVLDDTDQRFFSDTKGSVQRGSRILSLLKQLEYSESINEYNNETSILFELKKFAPYNDSIKFYIIEQLSFKDKYYQSEALRFEKMKRWEEAAKLYKAILSLNADNFDAYYKLGLLYITIQDMDNAFVYLDRALKLQKENPQVLYQMGVLMFFNDKFKEAIDYLQRAEKQNMSTALLYMYLGISFEKTGKNEDARQSFEKAIKIDPNDNKLRLLLDNLNIKMNTVPAGEQQGQKTSMIDDEKDESITIPVNKKAINARLNDDE